MPLFFSLYNWLRGTIFHPQWLSDRFHIRAKKKLPALEKCTILDIGSGNSNNSRYLSGSNRVFRLDYPATNIRYAALPEIFGDACALPVKEAEIDVVFFFEVLEHVLDYKKALQEIHRVLKSGGKLYISVPFIYPVHDAPYDFRRFTIHGLRVILNDHHFTVKQEVQYGNSFLVALQLMNLALLETGKNLCESNALCGILFSALAYPLCLLNNLLALPLTFLSPKSASCFGYLVIAERN
ncbi:MAG: hypothetical protein A2511_05500 [Deltaproteobacteria bacterium RIFOXYD12_FULL_50_9]|nr:MAG: hypothetical protein A2511_05500 [Deltaproteobacteria bacterium RIFOXYD12_FULL_50_9]